MITIRVPAVPVAQPRQRHRIASGNSGKPFVMNYTPSKAPVNDFKASVRLAASEVHQGAPLDGPLSVWLECVMPRPKVMCWKKKPTPRVPHVSKPDCDNLAKACLDALKQLAWQDDAQIADLRVTKAIAAGDEQPHVVITISPLV